MMGRLKKAGEERGMLQKMMDRWKQLMCGVIAALIWEGMGE